MYKYFIVAKCVVVGSVIIVLLHISVECVGKRILKIGPYFTAHMTETWWLTFLAILQ